MGLVFYVYTNHLHSGLSYKESYDIPIDWRGLFIFRMEISQANSMTLHHSPFNKYLLATENIVIRSSNQLDVADSPANRKAPALFVNKPFEQ